ncbi:MAG: GNAT family N-acetyltransferase [Flavobacteriia bacterium]|nr:GNAT family N-acetyltransferase [Flavobacteriia bacterium]
MIGPTVINTQHLKIQSCDRETLKAAIEGDEILSRKLNINVPSNWSEFGVEALKYSLGRLDEGQSEENWWTYLPIHKEDNTLIGSGGYKGKPSKEGEVEIGYEITPSYRNRGLATEMTKGLIENAFSNPKVKSVIAHTLGHENASTHVLQKCGFAKVKELNDPDEGLIWKWELKRM